MLGDPAATTSAAVLSPTRRTIPKNQERWSSLLDEELEQAEHFVDAKPTLSLVAALGPDDDQTPPSGAASTTAGGRSEGSEDTSPRTLDPVKSSNHSRSSKKHGKPAALAMGVIQNQKASAARSVHHDFVDPESPDISPKRSRRRRQQQKSAVAAAAMVGDGPRKDYSNESANTTASPCRNRLRGKMVADRSIPSSVSESPTRLRKGSMASEPMHSIAASTSPCRARVGPGGIMSTDSVYFAAPQGDASSRTTLAPPRPMPLQIGATVPMQSYPQQQIAVGMGGSGVMSAPVSPCRPIRTAGGGTLSTSPYTPCAPPPVPLAQSMNTNQCPPPLAQAPPMVFVQGQPMAPQPNCAPVVTNKPNPIDETPVNNILTSMLGTDSLRTGHDLAAQLMAAAPEIYED